MVDFPRTLVKNLCSARDPGSIPGLRISPGKGNGNPPQYSCLENPMDRGARQALVRRVARVVYNLATEPPPPTAYFKKKKINPLQRYINDQSL